MIKSIRPANRKPTKSPADPMPALLVALRAVAPILQKRGTSLRHWAIMAKVGRNTLSHWLMPDTRTADLAPLCRALKCAGVRVLLGALYGSGMEPGESLEIASAMQSAGVWGPAPAGDSMGNPSPDPGVDHECS